MPSPTVKKIAIEVGVSPATVSRALQDGAKYERPAYERRAERIRQLAREYGYRANSAAKAMKTGRFHNVGCLHSVNPDLASFSQRGLVTSLHVTLADHNYSVTSSYLSDKQLTDIESFPRFVRELAVDGLLIDYALEVPDKARLLIDHCQLPAVWINVKHAKNCVYPDDVAAGRLATEHLLELGHRKIVYGELSITSHYSGPDRARGYTEAMKSAGLQPFVVKPEVRAMGERLEMAKAILDDMDPPTAFVTPSPGSANPFVCAVLARGMTLGRDVAFVTINSRMDYQLGIEMTTVLIPFKQVGVVSAEKLLGLIENPQSECPPIAIAPGFQRGWTT